MRSEYTPDELLPLSGIQHFVFCRRQWALIQIEHQWLENGLTVDGKIMHERVDDPFFSEVRKGGIITRSMPISSYRLGFIGVCDVVEFSPSPDGVKIHDREGLYLPAPVEYKHGKEKWDSCDEAQLCAQAMCLEEMLSVSILKGSLFYGETRQRIEIDLSDSLRSYVREMAAEMHSYYDRGYTPKVKPSKACRSCSLQDICLPVLQENILPATKYIRMHVDEDE
jgi:CRISPR-associated exonuclease Cas4